MIKDTSSAQFANDVLLAKGKVLVDFWADWCSPCKAMAPILEEMSETLTIFKVNSDENSGLTAEYSIRSIPTIILFEDGKEINRVTGAMSKPALLKNLGLE